MKSLKLMIKLHGWVSTVPGLLITLGIALAVFSGCSNLQPVADFGKNASVIAGNPDVAQDYPASLQRQKLYGQTDDSVSDKAIATRTHQAQQLRDDQKILEAYARALGALASNDLIDYNKQIDALNSSLVNAKFATSTQTEGYASIAKLGLKLGTDIYRRHKLRSLITTYNRHIQKATRDLIAIVDNGYVRVGLNAEKTLLQDYVAAPAAQSTQKTEGLPEIINIVAAQQMEMLDKRKQNAEALVKGMQAFAKGHQELANNIGKVDFKVTLSLAQDYANQLRDILKSFRT
ncbi:MAG TPA: hypothetical protein VKS98_00670 [Chthoniobacterales bacterium]|nr:hypothetical protein [Chthoniobacterales bacterium]